jgi:hypothetical protein
MAKGWYRCPLCLGAIRAKRSHVQTWCNRCDTLWTVASLRGAVNE